MVSRKTYRCTLDQLDGVLAEIMADETRELEKTAASAIVQTARECRDDLESRARSLFGGTGAYASGMAVSANEHGLDTSAAVYNAGPDAPLGHLLENGHAIVVNRGGSGPKRMAATGKRVAGRPHWKPAFDDAVKKLDRRLRDEL